MTIASTAALGTVAAEPWHNMAQEHFTTPGASRTRWIRALAITLSVVVCAVASAGCQHNERPNVLGPGLDPPNPVSGDAGLAPGVGNSGRGGDDDTAAGSGASGKGGTGGAGGLAGGGGEQSSADAGVEPPSCAHDDAGIDAGGDASVDAGTLIDCDEDGGVSH